MQACFIWNISDVLGMCFSVYLTDYFQKLAKIIHSDKPKVMLPLLAFRY